MARGTTSAIATKASSMPPCAMTTLRPAFCSKIHEPIASGNNSHSGACKLRCGSRPLTNTARGGACIASAKGQSDARTAVMGPSTIAVTASHASNRTECNAKVAK